MGPMLTAAINANSKSRSWTQVPVSLCMLAGAALMHTSEIACVVAALHCPHCMKACLPFICVHRLVRAQKSLLIWDQPNVLCVVSVHSLRDVWRDLSLSLFQLHLPQLSQQ